MTNEIKEILDYFRKYATIRENTMISEIEDYITNLQEEIERLNNIINELEKYLEQQQKFYGINQQGFSWGVAGDCLDKLKELKDNK